MGHTGAQAVRGADGFAESFIFGTNVARLRDRQDLSVSKFALMANIARPTVYKIEDGTADLKLSIMKRVADALGTTVADLLTPPFADTDAGFYRAFCEGRTASRANKGKADPAA